MNTKAKEQERNRLHSIWEEPKEPMPPPPAIGPGLPPDIEQKKKDDTRISASFEAFAKVAAVDLNSYDILHNNINE